MLKIIDSLSCNELNKLLLWEGAINLLKEKSDIEK